MNAWNHGEVISFLIDFALDSIRLKKLTIEKKTRGKKVWRPERPQVHILLTAPKGQLKSTILREVSNYCLSPVFTDLTFPALVGSIDKETKQVIPAGAWECRKNLLLLDEWNFKTDGHDDSLKALLQFTESGEYSRKIARYVIPFESEKSEMPLFFKVKDGNIHVKTKFSLILASMYDLARRTQKDTEALVSRTIPYHYDMSRDELNAYALGKEILSLEPKEKIPDEVAIKYSKYKKIVSLCGGAQDGNALRTFGDVARAYAIYGWKPKIFDFIIERKNIAETKLAQAKADNAERYAGLIQNQTKSEIQKRKEEV
jgi:hypothetical protein